MGKDSSPAPVPDYVGAAQAQGQANIQAAQVGAALNRVNTNTPYGNLSYSQPNPTNPNQWQADVSLSPDQQKLLDLQSSGSIAKASDANAMLGTVQNATATPFDASKAPSQIDSIGSGPAFSAYQGSTSPAVSTVDQSGVPALNTDWGTQAQQAQDAAYNKQTSMLDPQYAAQEDALRSRLAASGVNQGSEAYTNALNDFNRAKSTDYGNARNDAVAQGNSEQATLAGESLAGNNQLYGQALSSGNFANTAQAQGFTEGNSVNQQNNTNAQQAFQNTATGAAFQNAARGQSLQEQQAIRDMPLNEYNAYMSGSQVTQPNFNVGTAQTNSPAAAPVFAGVQAQGNAALDQYNQQTATNNANTQAGASVGASALMAYAAYAF